MTTQRALLLTCTLFLAILFVIGAYWPGLYGPFFLDDLQTITPAKIDYFSLRNLIEVSLQNDTGPLGRPLSVATFALNNYWFGDKPFAYKAVNLGLHIFIAIIISFFIYFLIRLLPKPKKTALKVALITALIWLFHPLLVSTVLYPVQRMTQLCHLFVLLGLTTYHIGRIRLLKKQSHSVLIMGTSFFIFFPLSILSKETGILFIWYLFAIEYFILGFETRSLQSQRLLRKTHVLLSLTLVFAGLWYYWLNLDKYLTIFAEKNISVVDRLYTQSKALVFYIKLILLPQITAMGLYHDDFPTSYRFDSDVALCTVFLGLLGFLIYYCRKRAPIISFGLAWFFISHTIESTILPLEMVFEHRNYLASLGLLLIPSYYFVIFVNRTPLKFQHTANAMLVCVLALLLFVTAQRSISWSNAENFLAGQLYYHPNSARVHIELANLYLHRGQYQEAFAELDTAQNLEPYNAGISLHKILIFCRGKGAPPELYKTALVKVKQGTISPYVILVLDQMVKNMFNQSCQGIDKNKIKEIINEALENPFIWYKPMYSAVLYHLEGGIELLQDHVDQTRVLLNKSFETYPKRLDPLIQKAYIELYHHRYHQANDTVNLIDEQKYRFNSYSHKVAMLKKTINEMKPHEDKIHEPHP